MIQACDEEWRSRVTNTWQTWMDDLSKTVIFHFDFTRIIWQRSQRLFTWILQQSRRWHITTCRQHLKWQMQLSFVCMILSFGSNQMKSVIDYLRQLQKLNFEFKISRIESICKQFTFETRCFYCSYLRRLVISKILSNAALRVCSCPLDSAQHCSTISAACHRPLSLSLSPRSHVL